MSEKHISNCSDCGNELSGRSFAGRPGTDERFCDKCFNKHTEDAAKDKGSK